MNSGEKEVNRMAQAAKMSDRRNWKKLNGKEFNIYTPIAVGVICVVWFFAAHMSENNFLFPTLESVLFKTCLLYTSGTQGTIPLFTLFCYRVIT